MQGLRINGVQFNGPGLVVQGVQFNGIQFNGIQMNGPGVVLQGQALAGMPQPAMVDLSDCAAPAVLGHSLLSGLASARVKVRLAQN